MSDNERKYTREQMMTKIHKLLSLADDPNANEHLAAQASAKAQDLLQQWALSEAEVRGLGAKEAASFVVKTSKSLRRTIERWEDYLAVAIGKAFFVSPVKNSQHTTMHFAGRDVDVEVAIYTFDSLRNTLDVMAKTAFSTHAAKVKAEQFVSVYNATQCRKWSNCHPTVYRARWIASWLIGAEGVVAARLIAQSKTFSESSEQALVVVETRSVEAAQFANDYFKGLTDRATKSMKIFINAQAQGRKDGETVQIKKGLTDEGGPKLLH